MSASDLIRRHGETFEISRNGETLLAQGLRNSYHGKEFVSFVPGTDVRKGDLLRGTKSGLTVNATAVDSDLWHGEVAQVNAYFDHPAKSGPVSNTINIGSMTHSTIQQGSPGAIQQVTAQDRADVQELVKIVADVVDMLRLSESDRAELAAELDTIKIQLNSPKPKPGIIRETFVSIKDALIRQAAAATVASVSAAATAAAQHIQHWLSSWGS